MIRATCRQHRIKKAIMPIFHHLPKPDNIDLINLLRKELIKAGDSLSFAQFMELALYHPTLGYYTSENFHIGRSGDFITAPEISPFFARCFASACLPFMQMTDTAFILELGAGTGRFAVDLIQSLIKLNQPPVRYYIYEKSASLIEKQRILLKQTCPNFFSNIIWLSTLPETFKGVIIANEVLDALPVHCFQISENGQPVERCVAWQDDRFIWQNKLPTSAKLKQKIDWLQETYRLPVGYQSEICLSLEPLIKQLATTLKKGLILLADYGYGQAEYYHPQRNQGTLTCFYQHQKHANPLLLPGLQDITAHVDFTAVAEAAVNSGCHVSGFTSQSTFLLGCGLLTFAAEEEIQLSPAEAFQLHQAIKTLTLPTEMGEIIKMMALTKEIDFTLVGFTLQDRRWEL